MQTPTAELTSLTGQVIVGADGALPLTSSPNSSANLPFRHRWETFFNQQLSIFTVADQEYVLGVQIANLLNRETFNLYRSLKIKGIELIRAEPSHVEYLVACNSIRRGTHSVTLIRLADAISFVEGENKRGFRDERRVAAAKQGKRKFLSSSTGSFAGEDEELEMSNSDGSSSAILLTASADGTRTRRLSPQAWHLLLRVAKEEMASLSAPDLMVSS